MISESRALKLMKKSIELAKQSVSEKGKNSPKVGAVLSDSSGNEILTCYRGETGSGQHCEYGLLKKAAELNINVESMTLFVTLEPCVSRGPGKTPCAKRIVDAKIKEVYIGTLDPNPTITGKGELFLRSKNITVNRYPHDLIMELSEINKPFFDEYKESYAPNNSLFVQKKIPNIMAEYLREKKNPALEDLPLDWDIDLDFVASICTALSENSEKRLDLLNEAMGYSYDRKYLDHIYKGDVRGKYSAWKTIFRSILLEYGVSLNNLRTLVVGCGNGNEGKELYSDVKDLTLVDIAPKSLAAAKKLLNPKNAYLLNAQSLEGIKDNSIDAYISLMTYQSTYFDIKKALTEANRVLSNVGIIIISVARGFMKDEQDYIEGLIDPVTGAISKNRPFDLIERVRKIMLSFGLVSLGIKTAPSEIFIYARKI